MHERHSKGSLMLLEMLFVVFFFALVSAVYVQVFTGSKSQSKNSRNLAEATLAAQNLIEVFTEAKGSLDDTAAFLSQSTEAPALLLTTASITLYYDASWEALTDGSDEEAAFTATLAVGTPAADTHLLTGRVTVTDSEGTLLQELPVSLFLQGVAR